MGRGEKAGITKYSKRRIHAKDSRSDESDEDYAVGEDEEVDDSDEYCSSFTGEESEEGLGELEAEAEVEEYRVRKVNRSRGKIGFQVREKSAVGKVLKKSRVSYKEDDDEDYEDWDYDDDGDEEFTPDEFDLDDEDESAAKGKKVGRPPLREKGSIKKRKRKGNLKNFSKPIRKRPSKSHVSGKKSVGCNYGRFGRKNTAVKGRKKKNPIQRKRRFIVDSDSDFVISESFGHEYTISEEEREQVREASDFCRNLPHTIKNSSPTNRPPEEGELSQQRKRPGRKGKVEKEGTNNVLRGHEEDTCELREQPGKKGKENFLENFKRDVGKQVCGICFSEEGKKRVRGTLNCCSHYFCFACIMEWSKVESRCPLCKQRFVTISKPARANGWFDLQTVEIQVPECNQVYQPSEEELRGYLDPYENVICTECQQGGDDALMLLCDLCDSPAHTYCVGHGREVPEGNWYCEGCRPTALGSSSPQAPSPMPERRTMNLNPGLSPVENVRQEIDLNELYVPETPSSHGTGFFSSPRGSGENVQVSSQVSGAGALTVSERRRIQRQIHHLLNSRVSELAGRNRMAAATSGFSGNNLLGTQIEQSREVAYQPAIIRERSASHCTFSHRRSQDSFICSLPHRDFFPVPSQSRGQLIQGQISTSVNGFANEMLPPGLAALDTHASLRLGYEQLHPYNSRPNNGSDGGIPMYGYSEVISPSRTSQGA